MDESKRALLSVLFVFLLIGAALTWFVITPVTPLVWTARVALLLLAILPAVALGKADRKNDLAPDFLREILGKAQPFERDGVCFTVGPTVEGGITHFQILFQNRYAAACNLRVVISPPLKSFALGKRQFAGITVDIPCPGGAFGLARAPIAVPANFQGKRICFEVAAATRYLDQRGDLLRFRTGLPVGSTDASGLESPLLKASLLVLGGAVLITRPATLTCNLPPNVAAELPRTAEPHLLTLWQPGDPPEGALQKIHQSLPSETVTPA